MGSTSRDANQAGNIHHLTGVGRRRRVFLPRGGKRPLPRRYVQLLTLKRGWFGVCGRVGMGAAWASGQAATARFGGEKGLPCSRSESRAALRVRSKPNVKSDFWH